MPPERILVVDDEPQITELLGTLCVRMGYLATTAFDGPTALELAAKEIHSVAIVDLNLPGLTGMETIRRLKEINPDLEIIVFTGYPTFESSIDAIREQVFDYLTKTGDMTELTAKVRMAVERRRLILENRDLMQQLETERNGLKDEVDAVKRALEQRLKYSKSFVGTSEAAEETRHQIAGVAPSNLNVLLLGESGTGKDVIARLIHESSGRPAETFVKINCPAIPESLLESELFGHEAGAFTGAIKRSSGRFEQASGGTIFLDEIGDLPLALQSKLLQAVEQKQFYSVGGKKPVTIDVRVIAATNAPLAAMVDSGIFRADLYYRLNEYTIEIPPLRKRREDIPPLVDHFLEDFKKQFKCPDRFISPETMLLLNSWDWPGNVRELQSVIRRFALTGQHDCILTKAKPTPAASAKTLIPSPFMAHSHLFPKQKSEDFQAILETLTQSKWNRRKAAKKLNMSYSTLRRRISDYGLNSV